MAEIIMPKMGDAMTEGKILKWHKRPGETVAKGEPIAEIETDKVNVDIEAEEAGTLLEILVSEGQTAPVGATIAVIGAPGQQRGEKAPARPTAEAAPRSTSRPAPPAPARTPSEAPTHVSASPLARRLATEHGIDLSKVKGTGPEGRIIKEDVEALLAATTPAPPQPPSVTGVGYEDRPLTRMRQTIARRMAESKQHAPHFYVTVEIPMDETIRARQQLNATLGETRKVSLNDFVVKAAAMALRKFPNLNSALIDGTVRRYQNVHIAIAIALPEGLIAPVLHDCDRKSVATLGAEAKALAERARAGHLHPDDYEGSTFTVSNLGMFDVESFVAIINPPQAAILAVGSAQARPVVRDNQIVVASVMKLTLSADHRVTDGAEAAQFLIEVKRLLENPLTLFLQDEHEV